MVRAPSLSDDDYSREHEAKRLLFAARDRLLAEIERFVGDARLAASLSSMQEDQIKVLVGELKDDIRPIITDYMPDAEAWDEAISDARRGGYE